MNTPLEDEPLEGELLLPPEFFEISTIGDLHANISDLIGIYGEDRAARILQQMWQQALLRKQNNG
jgi:hypothetical protein